MHQCCVNSALCSTETVRTHIVPHLLYCAVLGSKTFLFYTFVDVQSLFVTFPSTCLYWHVSWIGIPTEIYANDQQEIDF